MAIKEIGGPIPCVGCGKNIIMGSVFKLHKREDGFICFHCYFAIKEFYTRPNNKLKQFKEE